MLRLLLALALLASAQPERPRPLRRSPCTGLRYMYYEAIRPQGFLGFLTPDASVRPVRDALRGAWRSAQWQAEERGVWTDYFDWISVCRRAQAKRLSRLWIGCVGDTTTVEARHYRSLGEGEHELGQVTAACVVSAFPGSDPDFDDLLEHALVPAGEEQQTIYVGMQREGDRYDRLRDPKFREEIYRRALENAVYKMGMQDRGIDVPMEP